MEESVTPLEKKIFLTQKELLEAVSGTNFYIEWLYISIALSLAILVGLLVQRRVSARIAVNPPTRIDPEFIQKPIQLIIPLLALVYLSIFKPFAANYGGTWITAVSQLCGAYLLAKCVRLIVRSNAMGWFISAVIMTLAVLDVTGFTQSITESLEAMAFQIGKFKLSLLNIIHGAVILVIVFWLAGASSSTLESYLRRSSGMSYSARELTVKFFRIFVYFTALLVTLSAVGVDLTAFAVFGGALGVGIGLGLQKITANFVSGITLLLEKSIKIGDLIEVGNVTGWVRQLNIRYTLVETSDGRDLLVPNEELVSNRFTNWTYSNEQARIEIKIGVAYGTDVKLARKLLLEAATSHPLCIKRPEPTCWMREFGDSSINFMLTFWISNVHDGRFGPQSDVMFTILEKFEKNGIEIPYPQRVVHMKQVS